MKGIINEHYPRSSCPPRYTLVARTLHWLMALALTALVTVGYVMKTLPLSPLKLQVYSWHKWAGISLLVLVILRLLWRLLNRPLLCPLACRLSAGLWPTVVMLLCTC